MQVPGPSLGAKGTIPANTELFNVVPQFLLGRTESMGPTLNGRVEERWSSELPPGSSFLPSDPEHSPLRICFTARSMVTTIPGPTHHFAQSRFGSHPWVSPFIRVCVRRGLVTGGISPLLEGFPKARVSGFNDSRPHFALTFLPLIAV